MTTFGKRLASLPRRWKAVGIDRWPQFVADAQQRARDPATQAAIERSRQPPGPSGNPFGFPRGRDAIRPVYPLETLLLGLGARGAVGAARALGSALLRQVLPESRPTAANAAKPEGMAGNAGKQAEPVPNGQPVRLHDGQQDKHIKGTNNYIPSRSTLTADPRTLLQRFAGRGQQVNRIPVGQAGSKEVFDAGEIIGIYRNPDGLSAPTIRGMIHYSSKGAHIAAAAPRNWQP